MPTFVLPNKAGFSVKFSPFFGNSLAVVANDNYGLTGSGSLFILNLHPSGTLECTSMFNWPKTLFDVVWSECEHNTIITASGDGSLQLWNTEIFEVHESHEPLNTFHKPLKIYHEHTNEVSSLDWTKTRHTQLIISSSWDGSIKIWDPTNTKSLYTYHTDNIIHNVTWSPLISNCFASVSSDGIARIWDTQSSAFIASSTAQSLDIKAHDTQAVSCDWSKYDQTILATGGSEGHIRIWDLRKFVQPIFQLSEGQLSVKRLQFSPFIPTCLAAVYYDFTTRIFDYRKNVLALEVIQHHTEFTYGLDWNNFKEGEIVDCSWDNLVHVFKPSCYDTLK